MASPVMYIPDKIKEQLKHSGKCFRAADSINCSILFDIHEVFNFVAFDFSVLGRQNNFQHRIL